MESERHILWTREFWEAMQPFSTGLTYVNYLDEGRPGSAAYGAAKYERLVTQEPVRPDESLPFEREHPADGVMPWRDALIPAIAESGLVHVRVRSIGKITTREQMNGVSVRRSVEKRN